MRRLYLQVYLAFLAIILVFAILVAVAWHHGGLAAQDQDTLDGAAVLIAERLPSGVAPADQQRALRAWPRPCG